MNLFSLFSKKMNLVYRIISVLGIVLLSVCVALGAIFDRTVWQGPLIYLHLFAILLLTVVLVWPKRFGLFSLGAFSYSVYFLIFDCLCEKPMGFFMFILSCAVLFARGHFRKHRWPKVGIAAVIFFGLFSTEIRFGVEKYFRSLVALSAYVFVIALIIFFYYMYLRNVGKSPVEKFLDLSQFKELTERDKEWLRLIQKETKYITIAKQYSISEGTVKNRMRCIFKILDVSDRIGFMATYGGYELKG